MKSFANSASLKAAARQALLGKYLTLSGAYLMLALLHYLIVVPSSVLAFPPPFNMILFYAADFGLTIFFAIFQLGIAFLFLSNACGQPVAIGGLFAGFGHGPLKAMGVQLFVSLLLLVPTVIPDILLTRYLMARDTKYLIYGVILGLVFLPFVLFVRILYSQVFFIMLDFPQMSARDCLRYSRKLMKGNMGRYLYLMISFLPLLALSVLSCGIGFLYVVPYRQQTYANFYLDLVAGSKER